MAQGTVDELRGRARQRIEVWFAEDVAGAELRGIPGLDAIVVDGRRLAATLSGPVDPVLAVLARHHLAGLVIEEPNLEDAFLDPVPSRPERVRGSNSQSVRSDRCDARFLAGGSGLGLSSRSRSPSGRRSAGSSGISEAIDQLPSGVVEAFGLAGFGTPAGFLRGNLYEFIVPLLLGVAAVAAANGLTAAEEDAGRMEAYLSQPVTRQAVFVGRSIALVAWLAAMTVVIVVVQLVSDAVVDLKIDPRLVASTVVLSGLLALLFGALALALAGWFPRPALVLSVGIAVTVGAYLVAALFPLTDELNTDERAVALEVGIRQRPARQRGGAMAVCRPCRADRRPGRHRPHRVRPARRSSWLIFGSLPATTRGGTRRRRCGVQSATSSTVRRREVALGRIVATPARISSVESVLAIRAG